MDQRYQYQSFPQPVLAATVLNKPIYRENRPANIHYDRRVVRGNTYAAAISTLNSLQAQAAAQASAQAMARTRRQVKAKATARQGTPSSSSSSSSSASHNATQAGFTATNNIGASILSAGVQTDDYLEDLVDQVQEKDVGQQTDETEGEKPMPVMLVTKPRGVDQFTSIEAGELFDHDLAVQPLLEVLIGKCTEQGLAEVREEEELKNLQSRIRRFEEERDLMIVESQRLENANHRRHEEKERRLAQERERINAEKELKKKLEARAAAHQYLSGLQENVFNKLEAGGVFYNPTERAVRTVFLPWLTATVTERLQARIEAQNTVDQLLVDAIDVVVQQKREIARQEQEARERERARIEAEAKARAEEAEARRREIEEQARLIEEAERMQQEEAMRAAAEAEAGDGEGGEEDGVAYDEDGNPMESSY